MPSYIRWPILSLRETDRARSTAIPGCVSAHRFPPLSDNSFVLRTYAKRAPNPSEMSTSGINDLKPRRMNTYKKTGGGGRLCLLAAAGTLSVFEPGIHRRSFALYKTSIDLLSSSCALFRKEHRGWGSCSGIPRLIPRTMPPITFSEHQLEPHWTPSLVSLRAAAYNAIRT